MAEVEKEAALEEPMLEETTLALEEATPTLEETTPTLEETSEQKEEPKYVKLGPKGFDSSTEMFEYFYDLVQGWNLNLDINEFEAIVLLELIRQGHSEPEKKIGAGVKSFQVRKHPEFDNPCFFIVRTDGSVDDFSFRKCVNKIWKLPENFVGKRANTRKPSGNKKQGGYKNYWNKR